MNEILMKKKCLQEAMRLCEIEILKNLVGQRVSNFSGGVVTKVDINEKDPLQSTVIYVVTVDQHEHKLKDSYSRLRIIGD